MLSIWTVSVLTQSKRLSDGRRFALIAWRGVNVMHYDDAFTGLRVAELLADEDVEPMVKAEIAAKLLFVNPDKVMASVESPLDLIVELVWKVARVDMDGTHEANGKKLIDWEQDEQRIRASVWQTYGKPVEEILAEVTLDEFASMLSMCPHETPIGQALYYRTAKPPKPSKHNAQEREAFNKAKRFYALKQSDDDMRNAADMLAAALVGKAKS